jgi:hypothetical protein
VYPKYGDIAGSWAQKIKDANQFIEVFCQNIYTLQSPYFGYTLGCPSTEEADQLQRYTITRGSVG